MPKTSPGDHGTHRGKPTLFQVLGVKALLIAGVIALAVLVAGRGKAISGLVIVHGIALALVLALLVWAGHRGSFRRVNMARHRGRTEGTVLHDAARYDLFIRLMTLGFEGRFRRKLLAPAHLQPGENILDVGCGTGSLAIVARRIVGANGGVTGLDASAQMIARARLKAARAGLDISFVQGVAESLPFDEAHFDVVVGTLMLHHVAKRVRPEFVKEACRVLKPSGRLVLVDFGRSEGKPKSSGLHRHGHVDMNSVIDLLTSGGFSIEETGRLGFKGLEYVVATRRKGSPG